MKTMKKIISMLLALTLVFAMSATTFAADPADEGSLGDEPNKEFAGNTASTHVSIVAGAAAQANMSATVPLNVTLAVKADKTIVAPTNYAIANTGSIALHVSGVSAAVESPYTFSAAAGANTLNLTLAAGTDILTLTTEAITLAAPAQWNIAANESLTLTFAGSVGNIAADITTAAKVFTVTYTITAGIAA